MKECKDDQLKQEYTRKLDRKVSLIKIYRESWRGESKECHKWQMLRDSYYVLCAEGFIVQVGSLSYKFT